MIVEKNQAGEYVVRPGDNLSKIATTQGRTLQELLASNPQYAKNPNLVRPGEVIKPGAGPSYASAFGNQTPAQTPGLPYLPGVSPKPAASPTTSFTKSLIDILKQAQGINQTGQANLMKQDQNIKGQGLKDAAGIFNNKYMAPSAGTSLGLSAQDSRDPLSLSIENQQKLATQNLGNITDIVDRTMEDYQKELDRAERAKAEAADAEFRAAQLAEQIRSNKASEGISRQKATTDANISGFTGTLSPLAQAVQNGTITLAQIPIKQRAQIAAELATSGIQTSRQQALQTGLDVVNGLMTNKGTPLITGFIQGKLGLGNLNPRSDAQLALNQFNQLKGILSLENREKLKGSGAISDFEFKVLSDAATSLGRNLGDTDFISQLQKVKDVFEGKYDLTNALGGNVSSDGQALQVQDPLGIR